MSSADAQLAAKKGNTFQPAESQEFGQHFDLTQPEKAMSSYQKLMHQHTQQQFQSAADSARRRSSGDRDARMNTLSTETSVDSTAS